MSFGHTVRETLICLQSSVLDDSGRAGTRKAVWDALVILAMHHKGWNINNLQVFGKVRFRVCFDAIVMRLQAALHAFEPILILNRLIDRHSWPVVVIEGEGRVLVGLRAILQQCRSESIKHFKRPTFWI